MGKVRPLTQKELVFSLVQQVNVMRQDLLTHVRALFSKNEGQDHDFKEIKREQEHFRTILLSFGTRLAAIERQMKVATSMFTLAQLRSAGIEQEEVILSSDFLAAWEERISEAVQRLQDLPDPCTPTELAAHFAIPYESLQKYWMRGQLTVTRTGKRITIARKDIAAYMNIYGVPCMRHWKDPMRKRKLTLLKPDLPDPDGDSKRLLKAFTVFVKELEDYIRAHESLREMGWGFIERIVTYERAERGASKN